MHQRTKLFFILAANLLYGCAAVFHFQRTLNGMFQSVIDSFQSFSPFG